MTMTRLTFAAGVIHGLRTARAGAVGNAAEALGLVVVDSAQIRADLDTMNRLIGRLQSRVADLELELEVERALSGGGGDG